VPQLDRSRADLVVRGLAGVACAIGLTLLIGARPVARIAGLDPGRASLIGLRLFGVRDFSIGLGLLRTAQSRSAGAARVMGEVVAIAQFGDMAVTTVLAARRQVPWRTAIAVLLGGPPTLAAAAMLRGAYSRS
jgi:hypothetical protein